MQRNYVLNVYLSKEEVNTSKSLLSYRKKTEKLTPCYSHTAPNFLFIQFEKIRFFSMSNKAGDETYRMHSFRGVFLVMEFLSQSGELS